MIGNLFSRKQPDRPPAQAPTGRRIYAIGDIHGCDVLLRKLHRLIQEHAAASPQTQNIVVYLGDYVDRGADSRGVIDLLLNEPLTGFESVYLKGNHEDSLLRFLTDEQHGSQWFAYGGDATLESYSVRVPQHLTNAGLRAAQSEFARNLPPQHLAFFRQLQLLHIEGDYAFVHAGIQPGIPLDQQSEDDLLWIRDAFLQSPDEFDKIIVHGHTITAEPTVKSNRIGIDTGAFATGLLTCLVLDGPNRSFLCT